MIPPIIPMSLGAPSCLAAGPSWAGWLTVGFSGSRRAPAHVLAAVSAFARAVGRSGVPVLVGDAPGVDAAVAAGVSRAPAGDLRRFVVRHRAARWGFAERSVLMVRTLADSPWPALVVVPCRPCPRGLVPSSSSRACFAGFGSGSWASAAFAAGLGVSVFVLAAGAPESLPVWGAGWSSVSLAGFPAWGFVPSSYTAPWCS